MLRALLISLLIVTASPASADVRSFAKRWSLRAAGVVLAVAVHEACHLATSRALGGRIRFRKTPGRALPAIIHGGLTPGQDRAVAASGLLCTAGVSEILIGNNWHRKNDIAWGFVADHVWNSAAYARDRGGDSNYWRKNGGDPRAWRTVLALHSTRTAYALAETSPFSPFEKYTLGSPEASTYSARGRERPPGSFYWKNKSSIF